MQRPDFSFERALDAAPVCGLDEVGRGPWAGPVVAAAVVLNPEDIPQGLNDSKKLSAARRKMLYDLLLERAQCGVGEASVAEIEDLNILRASDLAMRRAVAALPASPAHALVDGTRVPPDLGCAATAVVKGDGRCLSIAAASIVAKVTRDRIMVALSQQYPGYGWERNAGYPTKDHLEALRNLGVTPHHRRSFKPVHNILCQVKSVSI